jgi:hypothetical protein
MRTATGDNQLAKLRVGGEFIPALSFYACRTASVPWHMPGAREKTAHAHSREAFCEAVGVKRESSAD